MTSLKPSVDLSIDHLKNITTWISNIYDLNQLLELILETGTRIMRAKASSLLLLDQKTKKLYFKVVTGTKKDEVKKFVVKLGQGIAGHVAETGQPLLIEDVSRDDPWGKRDWKRASCPPDSYGQFPEKSSYGCHKLFGHDRIIT